jgi:hypothetical protein
MSEKASLYEISDSGFKDLARKSSLNVEIICFNGERTFCVKLRSNTCVLNFIVGVNFLRESSMRCGENYEKSVEEMSDAVLKNRLLFCSRYLYDDDGSVFADYAAELLCCLNRVGVEQGI